MSNYKETQVTGESWDEPGWREVAQARDQAQAQRDAEAKKPSLFVTGGG